MIGLWMLLGALASGPLWLLLARVRLRRSLRRVRRYRAQRRRREHLVEPGALTGGLAHEIRNPLSTIKLNLQLLIEDLSAPGPDGRRKEDLARLQAVANELARLQDVLEDFLRFIGRHELRPASVDLGRLVTEMTDFFVPQAQTAGVRIRTRLPDRPVWVRADADLLKQAMLNLMINAQQAMPGGGTLTITARGGRRWAQLDLTDTGVGMPPEVLDHIFEAYYTTKPGGSGLGLSIVHRIVQEHGGQIAVSSAPGEGTSFTIRLARARPPRHRGPEAPEAPEQT